MLIAISMAEKKVVLSEKEWKKLLTPEQYRVLREKGTERPWTGKYVETKKQGTYKCAACGNLLFMSDTKFESDCGWPSFTAPVAEENIEFKLDMTLFTERTEVVCGKCGGHLGHVFDDGPPPTGKRYCINSASLVFEEPPEPQKRG
jgi:peptide-methionine (R)-S-oxide reductase